LSPAEVRFAVRLTPRAATDRVDGVVDGVLRARVTAPPVDGAANEALLRLVGAELGVPRRDIRLVSGSGSRTKVVAVAGVPAGRLAEVWPGLHA
jgi:uncharacterized protein YggU (UPF0235/DUF167 family)